MFLLVTVSLYLFFFFQAEDGIRDLTVTGVQTCALPIFHGIGGEKQMRIERRHVGIGVLPPGEGCARDVELIVLDRVHDAHPRVGGVEIGRASCRGRGEISGGAGSFKKKKRKDENDDESM